MNPLLYISRSFVEFGPFSAKEILDFEKRGVMRDSDYVRYDGQDDWLHIQDWVAKAAPTVKAPAKKAPAKKAAAKAPAGPKAKAPAKKAAAAKAKAPKKAG